MKTRTTRRINLKLIREQKRVNVAITGYLISGVSDERKLELTDFRWKESGR
jgi:hypothetical protein